jgi:hypothetical protein
MTTVPLSESDEVDFATSDLNVLLYQWAHSNDSFPTPPMEQWVKELYRGLAPTSYQVNCALVNNVLQYAEGYGWQPEQVTQFCELFDAKRARALEIMNANGGWVGAEGAFQFRFLLYQLIFGATS